MGWRWHDDDDDDDDVSGGRGIGDIPDLANPSPRLGGGGGEEGARCATRRVVRSSCRTEEVEPGRFVRKCERTEQLLRDCIGRPAEVVESKIENTEEDVTDEVKSGSLSLGPPTNEPFAFPGLRSDIESLERGFFGGLGDFLEEAERMTNGFLRSFGIPSFPDRESAPFGRWRHAESHIKEDAPKEANESVYSEFSGQVREV